MLLHSQLLDLSLLVADDVFEALLLGGEEAQLLLKLLSELLKLANLYLRSG